MAGVLAQKTKQLLAQSSVEKPNTTKKISKLKKSSTGQYLRKYLD